MGNRAVISEGHGPCVYLHWNGGRDSVECFLKAARIKMQALPENERPQSTLERRDFLCEQVLFPFFGTRRLTVYKTFHHTADKRNGDNGTYIIDSKFNIIRREHVPSRRDESRGAPQDQIEEFMKHLLALQPLPLDDSNDALAKRLKMFEPENHG